MLLGEFDGLSAALGAAVSAVGGAVVAVLRYVLPWKAKEGDRRFKETDKKEERDQKVRRESYQEALQAYRDSLRKTEQQCERQASVIEQYQAAFRAYQEADSDKREEIAELRGIVYFLHDHLKRCYLELRECGRDMGELPELPPPRERTRAKEADFLVRQANQSASLTKEAGEVLKQENGGPKA
jgi:hypothetical protein